MRRCRLGRQQRRGFRGRSRRDRGLGVLCPLLPQRLVLLLPTQRLIPPLLLSLLLLLLLPGLFLLLLGRQRTQSFVLPSAHTA
jgi:hypothetical protein